jgi:hypothetical protein
MRPVWPKGNAAAYESIWRVYRTASLHATRESKELLLAHSIEPFDTYDKLVNHVARCGYTRGVRLYFRVGTKVIGVLSVP